MEDSGFATGGSASWDSTKTTDDAELPVASDEGAENCIYIYRYITYLYNVCMYLHTCSCSS